MIPEYIAYQPERGALGCHLTGKPPLNLGTEYILLYASLAATAASTAISYDAAQDQKKAVREQGEMNAKAAEMEAMRMQAETAENSRRLALQQRRAQAAQQAQLTATGFRLDTGTPLSISQDTEAAQARELGDLQYSGDVQNRALLWQAEQSRSMGAQQASAIGRQQTAGLISGIGSMASTAYSGFGVSRSSPYGSSGAVAEQKYSIANTNYSPRLASARPAGY